MEGNLKLKSLIFNIDGIFFFWFSEKMYNRVGNLNLIVVDFIKLTLYLLSIGFWFRMGISFCFFVVLILSVL